MIETKHSIHSTAIIDPDAKLGENVNVGPWTVIGPKVEIGDNTWVGSHVVIQGPTKIGKNNRIFQFASVGECPQDKKWQGEETTLEIGDGNTIREFCTFNRGTIQDKGSTIVGNNNWFMAYVHIAHDCVVGNYNVLANNASLAGHVNIGNFVTLSGFAGIHQFVSIGDYAFCGRAPLIGKDVLPYLMVAGRDAKVHGLNLEGLKRHNFSPEQISNLKQAYKVIFRQGKKLDEIMAELTEMAKSDNDIKLFVDSLHQSQAAGRGILR